VTQVNLHIILILANTVLF